MRLNSPKKCTVCDAAYTGPPQSRYCETCKKERVTRQRAAAHARMKRRRAACKYCGGKRNDPDLPHCGSEPCEIEYKAARRSASVCRWCGVEIRHGGFCSEQCRVKQTEEDKAETIREREALAKFRARHEAEDAAREKHADAVNRALHRENALTGTSKARTHPTSRVRVE